MIKQTKKQKIKAFLAENWLSLVNFVAWFTVYSLTNQVGIEALSGFIIFIIIPKTLYNYLFLR